MTRGDDKTDVEFWDDGLVQYFDAISDWSKNQSGSISFGINLDVNGIDYLVDLLFSYTTQDNINQFNAVLSIESEGDRYDVVIKDNDIYYMLDGYNAVEMDAEVATKVESSLPLGQGFMPGLGLGSILKGINIEETVYYGREAGAAKTRVEYLAQVKLKETLDAVDRHLSADTKTFVLDFVNSSFSTSFTSLSKDDNQIEMQLPPVAFAMGYVGTVIPGSSISNSPDEVYFNFKTDASTKPAFGGVAQDITLVFSTHYKTLQYTQLWQEILPLNTSNFEVFSAETIVDSVEDKMIVSIVTLLRTVLTQLAS